ncbi:MAG: amidohydrolase [Trueperaceae bacterium]|nr:MAG: amidohydrolase [Trueperaceae bacterium]
MADILFVNGLVLTQEDHTPEAQALALRQGRIVAVGASAELRRLAGAQTKVIDLDGRCLLPGFHDSHVHLGQYGFELSQVELDGTATMEEGLARVAERAAQLPKGQWLLGSGFALQRWGRTSVSKTDLDAVSRDHPMLLTSQDHHSSWANTLALEKAEVNRLTRDPPNGRLVRDASGEPTGLLLEHATALVRRAIPKPSRDEIRAALRQAGERLASYGITTVHHMAYEPADNWREMASLASEATFPLRLWACIPQEELEHALALGLATGQGGEHFAVGGAKFFTDGALGSGTAWMLEPYANSANYGMEVHGPEVLRARFPLAIEAGLVPVTHAIGDAANRSVLDALEATRSLWQGVGMRPRIEHAQHVSRDDIARFGDLGLIASMQPVHLTFDMDVIRNALPGRASRAYAMRSLSDAGALLAFGSDTPVASPDVVVGLKAACHRANSQGEVLTPAERLSPKEALAAYTRDAAAAIGWEHRSGRLRPGFDADLVIVSHDPRESLDGLEVLSTMKAGRWTYRGAFQPEA